MFKSGKSINITSKAIRNNGGILVAPQINVHGLSLTARAPISKEVFEFFTSKGAVIEQLEEDGDKLVRITGGFTITKKEMEELVSSNKDLKESKELKEMGEAVNFQKQIAAKLSLINKKKEAVSIEYNIHNSMGGQTILPSRVKFLSQGLIDGGTGSITVVGSSISGVQNFRAAGPLIIKSSPIEPSDLSTGILAEVIAKDETFFESRNKIEVTNAVVLSGKDINLTSTEEVIFKQEQEIDWINAPVIHSFVFSYDTDYSKRDKALKEATENPAITKELQEKLYSVSRSLQLEPASVISRLIAEYAQPVGTELLTVFNATEARKFFPKQISVLQQFGFYK